MKKTTNQEYFWNVALIIIVLSLLSGITIYSVNLINARSRDAKRISDLSSLKSALNQHFKMNKSFPKSGYEKLDLGMLYRQKPTDPLNHNKFKYCYFSEGESFALLARMEKPNYLARNDNGKYNQIPLYYEIGSGKNWQSLIPNNLK